MKITFRKKLIAAFVVLTGLATPALADEIVTYELVCRGGGNMAFGTQWENSAGQLEVEIRFERATHGAREEGPLRPGTCAWTDRALRDGEPLALALRVPANKVWMTCTQMICEFANTDPRVIMLTSLTQSSATWRMQVHNQNGRLQIAEVLY